MFVKFEIVDIKQNKSENQCRIWLGNMQNLALSWIYRTKPDKQFCSCSTLAKVDIWKKIFYVTPMSHSSLESKRFNHNLSLI